MTKVTHTETHDNTLVCKGKLVLLNNKDGVSFHDSYSGNMIIGREGDDLPLLHIKPIIVSETEKIEILDYIYDTTTRIIIQDQGLYYQKMLSHKKVLALPENFSPEILKDIVTGIFKDGDKVFVECEFVNMPAQGHGTVNSSFHKIKLNKDNHITILSGNKEWGWEDIEAKFRQTDDYKFTTARNINSAFVGWLQDNYNPPTKK